MAVLKLVCADTRVNRVYGLFVAFSVVGFDIIVISVSYGMILRTVPQVTSSEARLKVFGTCASHICVILAFYIPALFTFLTHRWTSCAPSGTHHVCYFISWYLPCSTPSSMELEPNRLGTGLFKDVVGKTPESKHRASNPPQSPPLIWEYKCWSLPGCHISSHSHLCEQLACEISHSAQSKRNTFQDTWK